MLTRRRFLQVGAAGTAALLLPPPGARAATSRNVLVVVFLRGGADGIHMVVPTGDPEYAVLRPTLALPQDQLLPLTSFFGLNPELADLQPLYDAGELAVIHCVGSPDDNRSHFDAQDFMERAAPGNKTVYTGWLNRYLEIAGQGAVLAGVTLGNAKAKSLEGPAPNLALGSVDDFALTNVLRDERKAAIQAMHAGRGDLLASRTDETLAVVETLAGVSTQTPVTYPDHGFARDLRDIAALIRADVGVHVAAVSLGGWDSHDDQINHMQRPMQRLAPALAAFHQDLGADASRVLTLVMTEFGRTVEENGTQGADHGRASMMLALGGGVGGGRVILESDTWPGLTQNQGYPRRDLEVTTDFRDVFAEVLTRHLGVADPSPMFPGFSVDPANRPGLFT